MSSIYSLGTVCVSVLIRSVYRRSDNWFSWISCLMWVRDRLCCVQTHKSASGAEGIHHILNYFALSGLFIFFCIYTLSTIFDSHTISFVPCKIRGTCSESFISEIVMYQCHNKLIRIAFVVGDSMKYCAFRVVAHVHRCSTTGKRAIHRC